MNHDHIDDPQILDATIQNLVTWVTMHLGFVHPWNRTFIFVFRSRYEYADKRHNMLINVPECFQNSDEKERINFQIQNNIASIFLSKQNIHTTVTQIPLYFGTENKVFTHITALVQFYTI